MSVLSDADIKKFLADGPRTEQEFLIGFLLGKDSDSEDVSGAYDLVTGERHNRKYTINDILK